MTEFSGFRFLKAIVILGALIILFQNCSGEFEATDIVSLSSSTPPEDGNPTEGAPDEEMENPPLPPNIPSGSSAYFDFLVARPELFTAASLRTANNVIENVYFSDKSRATTIYDPVADAARFRVGANSGSVVIGDQVRHTFQKQFSGSLLIYWETYWDSNWAANGAVEGVQTYKAFQLSDDGDLNTEIRTRFSQVNLPYVGRVDVRTYYGPTGPADSLVGQTGEFNILPNTWTRYWVFLDYDNDTFSLWVGDDQRSPVVLYDRARYNMSGNEINQFWFEYNTSQNRSGPQKYVWGRNLVILKDVQNPSAYVQLFQPE